MNVFFFQVKTKEIKIEREIMTYFKEELFNSQVPTAIFRNSLAPQMSKHGLVDCIAEVQISVEWLDLMTFDI